MNTNHEAAASSGNGLGTQLRAGAESMGTQLGELDTSVRTFVNQRPVIALLAAVGLGYVAARVFARL